MHKACTAHALLHSASLDEQAQSEGALAKQREAFYQSALQELTLFKSRTSAALLQVGHRLCCAVLCWYAILPQHSPSRFMYGPWRLVCDAFSIHVEAWHMQCIHKWRLSSAPGWHMLLRKRVRRPAQAQERAEKAASDASEMEAQYRAAWAGAEAAQSEGRALLDALTKVWAPLRTP